jgi:hypothetical protein
LLRKMWIWGLRFNFANEPNILNPGLFMTRCFGGFESGMIGRQCFSGGVAGIKSNDGRVVLYSAGRCGTMKIFESKLHFTNTVCTIKDANVVILDGKWKII